MSLRLSVVLVIAMLCGSCVGKSGAGTGVAPSRSAKRGGLGFPVVGPVKGADPSKREVRKLRVPTRLLVGRKGSQIVVSVDQRSLVERKLRVGHKMIVGVRYSVFARIGGKRRSLGGGLSGGFNLGTSRHPMMTRHGVLRPQSIQMEVVLFETDIPAQHLWRPGRGRYRELWRTTLRADGRSR